MAGQVGGLDFSPLINAVSQASSTLSSVAQRLQQVAPAAGSTDPQQSQQAQQEIQSLADQLNAALKPLQQAQDSLSGMASSQPGSQPQSTGGTPPPA
jgi:signal transduction histidine kinase